MRTSKAARTLVGSAVIAALVTGSVASASNGGGLAVGRVSKHGTAVDRTDHSASERSPAADALTKALERGKIDRAEYALERALSLFELREVRGRFGDVKRPDPHDATLFLRDLALHKNELSGPDRLKADSILARPTDGDSDPHGDGWGNFSFNVNCVANYDTNSDDDVCFNWIDSSIEPSSPDATQSSFVSQADFQLRQVWDREITQLGYKQPQKDANSDNFGLNAALDIYFADIGDNGLYGYCATDEPGARTKQRVSAYCVLDNDYSSSQYTAPPPEVSGLPALQVTLAHEFFHAIQFNYDWKEALFLMEGTATWIEDEVFDYINANYAFLFDSALHQPEIPLDAFQKSDDGENFEYGAWIFFRFLSEAYTYHTGSGSIGPGIVRLIWNRAEQSGKKGFAAIASAINSHGLDIDAPLRRSTPFRDAFALWTAVNRYYDAFYEEGYDGDACENSPDSYLDMLDCEYPPFDATLFANPSTGWRKLPLDRRSSRYALVVPGGGSKLKVRVNLPNRVRGGEASFVTLRSDFTPFYRRIKLNADGDGILKFPIDGSEVEFFLILTNTGSHNNETYRYKAEVLP